MSNVLIEKDKIDILANAISNKSGVPVTMTLAEMVEAVDGIETGGGGITPAGNIDITSAGTTDVTNYATATVPSAEYLTGIAYGYYTEGGNKKWRVRGKTELDTSEGAVEGWLSEGTHYSEYVTFNAIASGTSVTPTESSQTIGGANYMMEGAVTVNAIPSNYVGSGITQRQSSDLSASGATVTAPSGYYASSASKSVASGSLGVAQTNISKTSLDYDIDIAFPSFTAGYISTSPTASVSLDIEDKSVTPSTSQQVITPTDTDCYLNSVTVSAMPSGTEGTPTATKGTVSNHAVTVTPSVTNSAGYISGGTHNGTAVTVSASELVSGSQSITDNGDYDVTNLASVSVNVSGGGGGTDRLVLLQTTSLGSLSTSSTSGTDTGKTVSLAQSTGWQNYDLLLVDISVDTTTNGRHTSTVTPVILTGTSNVSTKNTYTVGSNKWNSKLGSTGTASTRQSTTAYGIYVNSASVSSSTLTMPLYYRYNSNNTGTINGTYTARVYGIKLIDLIGG